MQITCKLSGVTFPVPGYPGTEFSGLHPIFTLPLDSLHRIAGNPDSVTSPAQNALLFMAYLRATNKCNIVGTIQPGLLSDETVTMLFPKLVQLSESISRAPAKAVTLPNLSLSSENLASLSTWLDTCSEIVQYGRAMGLMESVEDRQYMRALATRRKQQNTRLEVFAGAALRDLLMLCPEFTERSYKDAHRYFVGTNATGDTSRDRGLSLLQLQTLKGQCMDYLPESNEAEYVRKQAVIGKLDASIATAIEMAHGLGTISLEQAQEQARELVSSYTVVTNTAEIKVISNEVTGNLKGILSVTADTPAVPAKPINSSAATGPLAAMLRAKGLLP